MPFYCTLAEIQIAAGGEDRLNELADYDGDGIADAAVLAQAQTFADAWIDAYARRLYGDLLPFAPAPDAIRALAAAETVYRLKQFRSVTTEQDQILRKERETQMSSLEAGKWNPVTDDRYPIGQGGGTPIVVRRCEVDGFSRDGLKAGGFS